MILGCLKLSISVICEYDANGLLNLAHIEAAPHYTISCLQSEPFIKLHCFIMAINRVPDNATFYRGCNMNAGNVV